MSKNFDSVKFIKQVLGEFDPAVDTRPSTAVYDLFIKPVGFMLQPLLDDATSIAEGQSLKNIETMTEDSADALIDNVFLTRRSGGKAAGSVRFYFLEAGDVSIPLGTAVLSESGLKYVTTADTSISREAMALNQEGGLYYINADVEASDYGDEYNVEPEGIVSIEGNIANLAKVSNPLRIRGGSARETNTELKDRAENAVTVRNLLSSRSIDAVLLDQFPEIKDLITIGFYDPEMNRDKISVTLDGLTREVHIGGAVDIYTQTSSFTSATVDPSPGLTIPASSSRIISETGQTYSDTVFTDANADFVTAAVEAGHTLEIKSGVTAGEYTVASVIDSTSLHVTADIPGVDDDLAYEISDSESGWHSPVIQITQVDRLDPSTLQPSGILLYDGRDAIIDPKLIVTTAGDPEIVLDSTDCMHCVYERDEDIYYIKVSASGNVLVSSTNISNSGDIARNPDIAIDEYNNVVIAWEESDSVSGNFEIYRTVLDSDGNVLHLPASIMSDSNYDFKDPTISCNANGVNIVAILNQVQANYLLLSTTDFTTILASSTIITGTDTLYTPKIDTNDTYSYVCINSNLNSVKVFIIDSLGFQLLSGKEVANIAYSNILPDIAVDSTASIYICWDKDNSTVVMSKLDSNGITIEDQFEVFDFEGYTRAPRIFIDSSDKIHVVAIEDIQNSGDIHYSKWDSDLSALIEDLKIQDQYNNADYVAMSIDSERRPIIVWDSYDRHATGLYYTKRRSQDYRLQPLNDNYRYSVKELINIKIDPEYSSDFLRFTYEYPEDLTNISNFVFGRTALDRVVNANYLVRYPIPSFVDIDFIYSGDDDLALESIVEYINNSTESSLAVSDLLATLPLSVSQRITLPVTLRTERHNIDGGITRTESQDKIEEPRTTRFIARDITVS